MSPNPHFDLPEQHSDFLRAAVDHLKHDNRIAGIAVGGSFLTASIDEYSDLDLVVVVEPAARDSVFKERHSLAGKLGPLLAAFTGEHVGEPRLLICLYGPPLLHVDLKFVGLNEIGDRVEDPVILWERDGRISQAVSNTTARYPLPDLQWIEDRFWVWIHYAAAKIARGELFEACDFLAFLRAQVLGPLSLMEVGARPSGVRKIEFVARERVEQMKNTLAVYDSNSCASALHAAVHMYRELRSRLMIDGFVLREEAEKAAMDYLEQLKSSAND